MKKQSQMTVLLIAACYFVFCFLCWFHTAEKYSVTERRTLAQFPEVSMENVQNGKFMTEFEEYTLDQFPMRDKFRSLKAWVSQNVFHKADNNEIYVENGYAVKMEYPLKVEAIEHALGKFEKIYKDYLENQGTRIYVSVVPDKNYFLADQSGHLFMDYEKLFQMIREGMPYAQYVDLTDSLHVEDYYKTDIHWRQEALVETTEQLADSMGFSMSGNYEQKTLKNEFYGVYFGQSALNLPGEKLHYLTNDVLEQCIVHNYENNQTLGIYDLEKAAGKDPYEIYLSGPVSLLTIENPAATTEKELIVFRDSFGSSLVPLMAEGYRKITLIDIRYIPSVTLKNYVEFAGKDVLFLYSTAVLNNSELLK